MQHGKRCYRPKNGDIRLKTKNERNKVISVQNLCNGMALNHVHVHTLTMSLFYVQNNNKQQQKDFCTRSGYFFKKYKLYSTLKTIASMYSTKYYFIKNNNYI